MKKETDLFKTIVEVHCDDNEVVSKIKIEPYELDFDKHAFLFSSPDSVSFRKNDHLIAIKFDSELNEGTVTHILTVYDIPTVILNLGLLIC